MSDVLGLEISAKEDGKNENVEMKAIEIPNAIIFPNSITGFMSPINKDKNATAVVMAAKKHGVIISFIAFTKTSLKSGLSFFNSLIFTKTCTVKDIVRINKRAIKFDETTLIFQFIKPRKPEVTNTVKKAFNIGKTTNQIFPKNIYSIIAKIKATQLPNRTRSLLINSIISVAIIEGPPRYIVAVFLYLSKTSLIFFTRFALKVVLSSLISPILSLIKSNSNCFSFVSVLVFNLDDVK